MPFNLLAQLRVQPELSVARRGTHTHAPIGAVNQHTLLRELQKGIHNRTATDPEPLGQRLLAHRLVIGHFTGKNLSPNRLANLLAHGTNWLFRNGHKRRKPQAEYSVNGQIVDNQTK